MAKENKGGTVLAFLTGIGIGAAAALLFAPKPGDEMRDDVKDVIADSVDQLRDQTKNFTRRSQKFVETAKEQVQDAVDRGGEAYKQAKKAGA
jgi:gas vesicle protein